jgi:glycosyltransferase involved in cell wall biosynthesis
MKAASKTVLTFHGSDILRNHLFKDKVFKLFINLIVSRVAHNIVQNKGMKKIIESNNKNVSVITCGVDTDIFKPFPDIKRSINPVIAFTSKKTNWVKNWELFEKTISVLNTKHHISYKEIDKMSRIEIAEMFSEVNCLLMTSHTEGSPQVVKEALACNCPVVSVDVGDVRFQLEGVDNCYVSNKKDPHELAGYIERIISDPACRSNGLKVMSQKGLTQKQVAGKIYSIYSRIKHFHEN